MDYSEIQLPSNKRFGFFFTFVCAVAAAYFYTSPSLFWAYMFTLASAVFLCVSVIKAEILMPLNKLWMMLGMLIGMVVSPIVLGIIFFGMFTPISFLLKVSGRDELRLKLTKKQSYWVSRNDQIRSGSFKRQF